MGHVASIWVGDPESSRTNGSRHVCHVCLGLTQWSRRQQYSKVGTRAKTHRTDFGLG